MIFRRRRRREAKTPLDEPGRDEVRPEVGEPSDAELAPAEGQAEKAPEDQPPEQEPSAGRRRGLFATTRAALAPVDKRHVVIASVGLMGFATAGVLLFSAVSFWWTSQPSFCNRCHVMEPYVAAWKQSPHQNVNCESCHLTPGFFGYMGGKISGLQVVMNYIRGEYHDWSFNAAVSNASCLQCHESILDRNIHDPTIGITVSHKNIIGMGGKCLSCHSTVAHGAAVSVGSETHPTMATCLRCHNDKIAPLECDLCHTGRAPPSQMPSATPAAAASGG